MKSGYVISAEAAGCALYFLKRSVVEDGNQAIKYAHTGEAELAAIFARCAAHVGALVIEIEAAPTGYARETPEMEATGEEPSHLGDGFTDQAEEERAEQEACDRAVDRDGGAA